MKCDVIKFHEKMKSTQSVRKARNFYTILDSISFDLYFVQTRAITFLVVAISFSSLYKLFGEVDIKGRGVVVVML